jgi:hypothetical protein
MTLAITSIWVFVGIILVASYYSLKSDLNNSRGRQKLRFRMEEVEEIKGVTFDNLEHFVSINFKAIIFVYSSVALTLSLGIIGYEMMFS